MEASKIEVGGIVEDIKDIPKTEMSIDDLKKALFSAGDAKPDPTATHLVTTEDGMAVVKELPAQPIEKNNEQPIVDKNLEEQNKKLTLTDILTPEQKSEEEVKSEEVIQDVKPLIEQTDYLKDIPVEVQNRLIEPYLARIEELENKVLADEVYLKDKLAFIAQYSPEDFKLEPKFYLQEKLKEEFGEEFKPDANEALIYGTPSYNYVERQKELLAEATKYKSIAEQSVSERELKVQQLLDQARDSVKKEYGLPEEEFNAIDLELSKMSNQDAYKLVFEGMLAKRELAKKTAGLKSANERSKIPPTVQDITAGKVATASADDKALEGLFGQRWQQAVKEGKVRLQGVGE